MNNLIDNHFKNLEKLEKINNNKNNNNKNNNDIDNKVNLKKTNKIKIVYKKNNIFFIFNFIMNKIFELMKFFYCLILATIIFKYVHNCKIEFLKIYNDLQKNNFIDNL